MERGRTPGPAGGRYAHGSGNKPVADVVQGSCESNRLVFSQLKGAGFHVRARLTLNFREFWWLQKDRSQ